jgi:integrase
MHDTIAATKNTDELRLRRPAWVEGFCIMALKLTDTLIRSLAPPATGALTVWDSEITGFAARVFAPTRRHPEGAKSFFVNYRVDGRERRLTVGSYPEWSAEAARREAKGLRRRIDRGEDPADEKRACREAPTVKDLAERYKAEHLPRKAASSQKNDWAMITNEILPRLGARKVAEVHFGDIEALHRAIADRGVPIRANRVLAVASKMFSLTVRPAEGETKPWRDQAQGNPCKGVERHVEEGHERFFSQTELAALSDALAAYGPTPAANCIRFAMLTGCRPGEAMRAQWSEFDDAGYWDKPSAHTKQRKRHRVPLSPASIELIAQIRVDRKKTPRTEKSEFVFPGEKHGEPLKQLRSTWEEVSAAATIALWREHTDPKIAGMVAGLEASLHNSPTIDECRAFAAAAGVKLPAGLTDARIYDLRHTFASVGAGGGLSLQIIGRLLGHTQARTTQRYAHLADDPLREATNKIGAAIAGAGKDGRNIERLRERPS